MKKIKIGDKSLGDGEPVFTVAEIGVNHNGSMRIAKKLIDAAKSASTDAVKFQAYDTKKLVTRYAEKAKYQKLVTDPRKSQFEMLKKLELRHEDLRELFLYAKKRKIVFLCSAFDAESVDYLDEIGVPAFKVASGEITNLPLLRHIGGKKKPVILSTGMSTMDEIQHALKAIRKAGSCDIVLLQCVSEYPAKVEDSNLRAIETLRQEFDVPVGFSDHSAGIVVSVAAAALGAVLIEKHFTLDKTMQGPDHRASLEPDEMKKMIEMIRDVQKSLGTGLKVPSEEEEILRTVARRSIVAKTDIPRGTRLQPSLLDVKRPGSGIPPEFLEKIVGKKTKIHVKKDDLLTWEMLE